MCLRLRGLTENMLYNYKNIYPNVWSLGEKYLN